MDEPLLVAGSNTTAGTGLILFPKPDSLPAVWAGPVPAIDAGSGLRAGAPAAHAQVLAVYALMDRLRQRHAEVEWESCAAGGGRIDLAIPPQRPLAAAVLLIQAC